MCVKKMSICIRKDTKEIFEIRSVQLYKVPLGRKAELSEISGAVVYLSSKEASYISGHNLIIDGGWVAW